MFARVSTYTGDADQLVAGFESVTEPLEQMEGFSHAYFLVDRPGRKGISITMWESEEALSASAAKADELRKQGAETGRGSIDSVDSYEVAMTLGAPATP